MEHVLAVDTIDELKDVMPESGSVVMLLGRTRPGDNGGGLFHWDADSSREPDDGIIIKANEQPRGRWLRTESDPIDVRWFGAEGDGGESTGAIQRALDAASAGGSVRIPTGRYLVSRPLRIHQGTILSGDGLLSVLQYTGTVNTGCVQSATPDRSCAFRVTGLNFEILTEGAWAVDLRGMSFSRFDQTYMHLRKPNCSGYYGPGDGQSPYYNVFTGCHVSGPGNEADNGCVAFNFTSDPKTQIQSANANQVLGGHVNSCQKAIVCQGTGNVFYGQVLEQNNDGYVFGLPQGRLNDASKGTSNSINGCYTEYVKRVIVQEHESCYVTAELALTTGYETIFEGNRHNCVVLTGHEGQLDIARSFVHRRIDMPYLPKPDQPGD